MDLRRGEVPKVLSDPFCWRDFEADRLRMFLSRLAVAFVWFYFCAYVNNLAQAWLQANTPGFYESNWGRSAPNASIAGQWLEDNMPQTYDRWWSDWVRETQDSDEMKLLPEHDCDDVRPGVLAHPEGQLALRRPIRAPRTPLRIRAIP